MTDRIDAPFLPSRRLVLTGLGAGLMTSALPFGAFAEPADADAAIREMFGDKPITEGRVTVKVPPIAENGNSVSVGVIVDSPMSADDHVTRIGIFSPRNPIAEIARFELGPRAGRAEIATRMRMAGTQRVRAVAEMSDGTLWQGAASTVVTLAACVIG